MHILPQPKKFVKVNGTFCITDDTRMFADAAFADEARRFADAVEACCGFTLQFADAIEDAQIIFDRNDKYLPEQYFLMISNGVATITCNDDAGCFYAVETLCQLLDLDVPQEIPACENCYIEDAPLFSHRGLMFDVCRHFFGVDTVKKIIDLMARNKLNRLHLHLSDDQGFRVQIDKYPLLTSVGGVREGSEVFKNGVRCVDDVPHSGYFTKDDIAEIVAYAKKHKIEVIPEIDLPGHAVAMLAAYPQYSCLAHPMEVRKKWGISKDILCAGNDETIKFVQDITDEICEMFPYEYIHLGGDEAPKDRWCNCPLCKARLADLKLADFDDLQTWFVEQIRSHLQQKGKKVICWNDGLRQNANSDIVCQFWVGKLKNGAKFANEGRKVIMSPFFHMYFDYPYAMTPLAKTHRFNALKGVKRTAKDNVLGVEGTLWTEWIADEDKLFFNLLPRINALGECGWGTKCVKFGLYVKERFALYEKLGLCHNRHIRTGNLFARTAEVRKFFKKDPNAEMDKLKS